MAEKVIIMGAAGRDFHNFNIYFKNNPRYRVVAFTAAQIPDIEDRSYPPELAGDLYPDGIPIYEEKRLAELIRKHKIDLTAFSYSDISHLDLMHKASLVMAEGADFILIGATYTMLRSKKTVISVGAVRTGCGKSQTTRKICEIVKKTGKNVVVVRHPMPYGDLKKQIVQRFSRYEDFEKHNCTIEEREEYEPLVDIGVTVFAGIDYARILESAEKEADIIIWDGGNNDTPFYYPDIHVVLFDPHRPEHERLYYPGETNMLMADIAIINKVDSAPSVNIHTIETNIRTHAPGAKIIRAESEVVPERAGEIKGKTVLVVEDGPTLTHGNMAFGAGFIAARKHGAKSIADPRPYAVGSMKETFENYPHIESVLPAMGYSKNQIRDLEKTIHRIPCELIIFATPIHPSRFLKIDKPILRVAYNYRDHGFPTLEDTLLEKMENIS